MHEYYPLIVVGAILGTISTILLIAFALVKDKKESMGFDRKIKDSELIRRLAKYARPYWKNFVLVGFLMLISIAYEIVSPLIIKHIEELVLLDFELNSLYIAVGVYASVLVLSLVSTYLQSIILQKTGQKIVSGLREDVFTHIESLSHAQLHSMPVGKLVTRVANDTNAISHTFTSIVVQLAKNMVVVAGVLVAMFCLNYLLALMILCFVPFIVLFTIIFRKFTRKAFRREKDCTTDINTYLSEHLSGMKVIQIFSKEEQKIAKFNEKNNNLYKAAQEIICVFGIFRPLIYLLSALTTLCLFYVGSKGYIEGTEFMGQAISSGTIVAFYMYVSKFFNPIQSLAEQFHSLQSSFASAEKIFTILDMNPEVVDDPDAIELDEVKGEIEFRNVWFQYVSDTWVLKNVSFKIEAGQTVAFVGATGSGKTTILSLLCRNYDIQQGEILLDGININKIKISSLRKHFGQMLQDVFLFSGTIKSNITLRDEEFTDEEIMDACRYVNADKLIAKLPKGLDEEVRERGNNFSAGQRQLLSFARTMIRKPEVMILDEATANIDTETEQLIQDSLVKMMNAGTMLIVAHRLSTIQHSDNIIVLSDGEILEQGTHNELLKKKGKYHSLYMLQYEKQMLESAINN
ncbi:MAG: ABC transporter ATP-binding protein [Clostridia bacterium]|nr:ABC transporter ATP-binding protein [Clostridia bacterium]